MKVISSKLKVEMTSEEATIICKMIGPTSHDSRKKDFGLTERETNIAEQLYNDLSIIRGDNDE